MNNDDLNRTTATERQNKPRVRGKSAGESGADATFQRIWNQTQ